MNVQITKSTMGYQSKTLRQTVVLGIFFMLLVTTYISFSYIISFIAQNSDQQFQFTGQVALIVNYLAYLIGLTRATSFHKFKRLFLIAALCYGFNYALYIFELGKVGGLIITIVGAAVGGYGASILWASQGGYMMKLFKANKIKQNHQGKYFGILNGLVFASALLGAITTTFFLGLFGDRIYFMVLTLLSLLSFLFCYFLLDPLNSVPDNQLAIQNQEKSQAKANNQSFIHSLKQNIKFCPKMKHIIISIVLDGIILGFTSSNLSNLIPEQLKSDLNVGYLLIFNGVGGILGGAISGFMSDYITVPKQGIIVFSFIILTMLVTSLKAFVDFQTLTFAFCTSFCWGLSIYALQGWIFVSCIKIYQGKIQSFAIVKEVHTFSFILFQIYMIISNQNINLIATLCVLIILCLLSCLGVILLQKKLKDDDTLVEQIPAGSVISQDS